MLTGSSPNSKPERQQRRRLRLPEYDYARPGAYFVTICTLGHLCLFGEVLNGEIVQNAAGKTVEACWNEILRHFPHVEVDSLVVMPNHVHGVLSFVDEPALAGERTRAGHARPLHVVVGSFKSAVSSRLGAVWQRSFWDRVVRSEEELDQIRVYIEDNPLRWPIDTAMSHH